MIDIYLWILKICWNIEEDDYNDFMDPKKYYIVDIYNACEKTN